MEVVFVVKDYNTLDDFNVEHKTVLVRVDFNLPLDKKTLEIMDTTRIQLVIPTLTELIEKKAKVVILSHQGRKGDWDFTSMQPHAHTLGQLLNRPVIFVDDIFGENAKAAISALKPGEVLMLDNVRRWEGETEKKTAEEHAQSPLVRTLAPLVDLFVNDAFAAAHRKQCSLVGFTAVLPSAAGRLLEKELTQLEKVVQNPEKPCVHLYGGAKFSDVVVTIDRVLSNNTADQVLLTGLPANAFLKAKGKNLGSGNENALSKEGTPELYQQIQTVLTTYGSRIILPTDFAVERDNTRYDVDLDALPVEENLYDIGDKTIQQYKTILANAKTVFLSGPCGVFENPLFQKGTREIFTMVAHSDVFSIVGGGHTIAAVEKLNLKEKISHVSSGGGSLEKYMMGEKLVAVEALKQAKQRQVVQYK